MYRDDCVTAGSSRSCRYAIVGILSHAVAKFRSLQ